MAASAGVPVIIPCAEARRDREGSGARPRDCPRVRGSANSIIFESDVRLKISFH